jgi:Flp pilus assembly protein TadG
VTPDPKPARRRRCRDEHGAATLELVVLVPLLVVLVLAAVGLGRVAAARIAVDDAAHQAARAASLTRDPGQADLQARHAAGTALAESGRTCSGATVRVRAGDLAPGTRVASTVTCTTELGDVLIPGMPGRITLTGRAASDIDTFRGGPN